MQLVKNVDAPYYIFDGLSGFKEIKHFVSTIHGGVSDGAYASLNIGFGTDDDQLLVLQNRKILAKSVDIPLESFVFLNQVHKSHVALVTPDMKGFGAFSRDTAICSTDAMITNSPDICLFVMSADCVPLLFFDPVKRAIGACHAGWRGTVDRAPVSTLKAMNRYFGTNSADVLVAIGPSIGPCCYNVGGEVIDSVLRSFGSTDDLIRFDKFDWQPYFDLWSSNKYLLHEAGVSDKNIEISGLCTQCHHADFFSSRHGKGITGRFGAGIMLK
jgi:polyphenol oxidase